MAESMEVEEETPQSKPLPGQTPNTAGGFSWEVDDMQRLRRFLVLGSEGGTYYIGEKELGRQNAEAILRVIKSGKGCDVVREVVMYSVEGRTAKQNPIIFALALCAREDNLDTKKAAYEALNKVCRIPTHLFAFVQFCEALSAGSGTGWGRAHRRAVQNWYLEKTAMSLSMAVTKYQQREGWSHRDLLRLSHVKSDLPELACVFKYIVKGMEACRVEFSGRSEEVESVLTFLNAVELAKESDETMIVQLIKDHGLVREHVPTQHLNSESVWAALLEKMPMTAMIRNLGKMSNVGLLKPLSSYSKMICDKLRNDDMLKRARIHPFNVLLALKTYEQGHGDKGKLTWPVDQSIVSALNDAFYLSFKFVEPTGKRFLLAVDVSGSMCCSVMGSRVVTCRDASAAMAMVTARVESRFHILGFSHKLVPLAINPSMSLQDVVKTISNVPMGGTDCAIPMIYAKQKKLEVDVFIVYTDSETWFGKIHPSKALQQYRKATGIDAKLIVCGMASNGFTIADPNDRGMLDIVGFDSAAPEVISNFTLGMF